MNKPRAILGALGALLLGACAAPPEPGPAPGGAAVVPDAPARADRGIELRLMSADDTAGRVARSLASYDEPAGVLDEGDRALWRAWGLRWIAVPSGEIDALLGAQRPTRAPETRWLGRFPQWRALIRSGAMRGRLVSTPSGSARAVRGRPRLLARAWETPEIRDSGLTRALRFECALQLVAPRGAAPTLTPTPRTPEIRRGELYGPGSLGVTLDGDHALVLVGVDPDIVWEPSDGGVRVERKDAGDAGSLGPGAPRHPSLGSVMLSRAGAEPVRVLLVIVPVLGGAGGAGGAS